MHDEIKAEIQRIRDRLEELTDAIAAEIRQRQRENLVAFMQPEAQKSPLQRAIEHVQMLNVMQAADSKLLELRHKREGHSGPFQEFMARNAPCRVPMKMPVLRHPFLTQ